MRPVAAVAVLVLCLAPLAGAGDVNTPEVVDQTGDLILFDGMVPWVAPYMFQDADMTAVWVSDGGHNVIFGIASVVPIDKPTVLPQDITKTHFKVHFQAKGKDLVAGGTVTGGTTTADDDTSNATVSNGWLLLEVPWSKLPAGTTQIEGVYAESFVDAGLVFTDANDRAPDTGVGAVYKLVEPVPQPANTDTTTTTSSTTSASTTTAATSSTTTQAPTTSASSSAAPTTTPPVKSAPTPTTTSSTSASAKTPTPLYLAVAGLAAVVLVRRRLAA